MVDEHIITAIDLLKLLKSNEAIIDFIKKDGSRRIMKATLDFNRIPKKSRPKSIDVSKILEILSKRRVIRVFDVEKSDWRSVNLDTIKNVNINSVIYRIK